MNIQGSNLLSMLTSSEGLGNLQQNLSALTGEDAGFASALMEQLGLLQDQLDTQSPPDQSALQSWTNGAGMDLQQSGLQNFAAILGQDMPSSGKPNPNIDLEDTLQTLSEVLQKLQFMDAEVPAEPGQSLPDQNTLDIEAEVVDSAQTEAEQASVEAAALLSMPQTVSERLPTDASSETPEASETQVISGIFSDSKKPVSFQSATPQTDKEVLDTKKSEADLEFDRNLTAALKQEASDTSQDKPAKTFKPTSLTGKLAETTTTVESSKIDGQKSTPDIVGELSRMNHVLKNDTTGVTPSTSQPTLTKHFTDPGWHQELGDKLVWMHKQAIPSAELRLNPEHLGPILVKIDVSQEQASVAFTAQHQAVKEAIEAAIPKLREMLGGQHLNLVDVNVSQQQSDQKQPARDFFQMASEQGQRKLNNGSETAGVVNEAQNIVDEIEAGRAIASQGLLSLFA